MKESNSLELKREITNSFLKTVSAFANYSGGTVIFGINDKGETIGITDPDQICLDIENRINDSITPRPDYSFKINRRTRTISLTVAEGSFKPYLYKGKAYKRNGTATIEVDQTELKRLVIEGANLYFENLPVEISELSFDYLESAVKERMGVESINSDILRTFGLIDNKGRYNVAAELFADKNDYPGIDVARFGKNLNEILDRETISAVSILRQYSAAIQIYKRYYQYEAIEGFERKKVERIPEEAFREAIANALVHRTWDVNSHIRISMFHDRIEVASPGGLPKGITYDEYLNGSISNLRNPIIGNVFFRLRYIEMFGTGIKRIKESYIGCKVKPTFDITENTITVILPCTDVAVRVTEDGMTVKTLLDGGMKLSSGQIAQRLGWNKDKAIRVLNSLLKTGSIIKEGNGRGTVYSRV